MCKIPDNREIITTTTNEDLNIEYLTDYTRNEKYFREYQEAETEADAKGDDK